MLTSLIAVFLVLATGWLLKARGLVAASHWLGIERLTYQVLFPAVVIHTLAVADLAKLPVLAMGVSLVSAILIVATLLLLTRPLLARAGVDGPAFTSIFQGSVRWNTFVALALAAGLQGRDGTTLMAIAGGGHDPAAQRDVRAGAVALRPWPANERCGDGPLDRPQPRSSGRQSSGCC